MNPISLALRQEEERLHRLNDCLDAEASFQVLVARRKMKEADEGHAGQDTTKAMESEMSLPTDVLTESTSRTIESSGPTFGFEMDVNPYFAAALRSELQSQMQLKVCLEAELACIEAGSFQGALQVAGEARSDSDVSSETSDLDQTEAPGDMLTSDDMSTSRTMGMESKPELVCSNKMELVEMAAATDDILKIDVQSEGDKTWGSLSQISCDRVDNGVDIKHVVSSGLVTYEEESVVERHGSAAKVLTEHDLDGSGYCGFEPSDDIRTVADDDQLDTVDAEGTLLSSVGSDVNRTIFTAETESVASAEDRMVCDRMPYLAAETSVREVSQTQTQLLEDDSVGEQTLNMSDKSQSLSVVSVSSAVVHDDERADLETLKDTDVLEGAVSEGIESVETDHFGLTDAVVSGGSSDVTLCLDETAVGIDESAFAVVNGEASSREKGEDASVEHITMPVSHEEPGHEGYSKEELSSCPRDKGVEVDSNQHELEISVEPISDGSRLLNMPAIAQVSPGRVDTTVSEPVQSSGISSQPTIVVPWLMPKKLEESNKMLREERSLRMMLEQLTKITQDECNGLRALLARETTTRMKMENQVADLKVPISV